MGRHSWGTCCLDDFESGGRTFAIISLLCLNSRRAASGLGLCLRAGRNIECFDFLQGCANEVFPAHIIYRIEAVLGLCLEDRHRDVSGVFIRWYWRIIVGGVFFF